MSTLASFFGLFVVWAFCTVVAGTYLGVVGAIAWKVMQALL